MQQSVGDVEIERNRVEVGQKRKIKPTRRSNSGYFPLRDGESIPFESTLERDFLQRTAFSVDVIGIIPQPVEIPFEAANGRPYIYTPDYLVYFRSHASSYHHYPKPLLVEVKPEAEWREYWRSWSNKWKAANRLAAQQGWTFRIMDESRIRDQVLENILFLEKYKRIQRNESAETHILASSSKDQTISILNILKTAPSTIPKNTLLNTIWQLMSLRLLDCDIRQTLTVETEIWRTDRG